MNEFVAKFVTRDGLMYYTDVDDRPTLVIPDGQQSWQTPGVVTHREDGPAVILPSGEMSWWLNGNPQPDPRVRARIRG